MKQVLNSLLKKWVILTLGGFAIVGFSVASPDAAYANNGFYHNNGFNNNGGFITRTVVNSVLNNAVYDGRIVNRNRRGQIRNQRRLRRQVRRFNRVGLNGVGGFNRVGCNNFSNIGLNNGFRNGVRRNVGRNTVRRVVRRYF